jgi:hypothetical protein
MSDVLRTLTGDARRKFRQIYADQRRVKAELVAWTDPDFQAFLKDLDATEKALQSPDPEVRRFSENLTRLAPDWDRRRRQGQVRMKTFLKIYISKWFWRGLEWQEREFVLELLRRVPDTALDFLRENQEFLNRKGFFVVFEMDLADQKRSVYARGIELIQVSELLEYIFPETDFLAVWKLKSVQSLRDHLFVRVTGHEHEGKKGIRKPKIRGYRDGKASPRDPNLIKMALEADRFFYETEFETRWNQLEEEINRLCST